MLQILPRGVHIHIYGLNQLKIMYFNIVGMYTLGCVHVGECAYRYGGIQRLQVSLRCLPDQSPPYILSMEFIEWLGSKPQELSCLHFSSAGVTDMHCLSRLEKGTGECNLQVGVAKHITDWVISFRHLFLSICDFFLYWMCSNVFMSHDSLNTTVYVSLPYTRYYKWYRNYLFHTEDVPRFYVNTIVLCMMNLSIKPFDICRDPGANWKTSVHFSPWHFVLSMNPIQPPSDITQNDGHYIGQHFSYSRVSFLNTSSICFFLFFFYPPLLLKSPICLIFITVCSQPP